MHVFLVEKKKETIILLQFFFLGWKYLLMHDCILWQKKDDDRFAILLSNTKPMTVSYKPRIRNYHICIASYETYRKTGVYGNAMEKLTV